MQSQKMTRPRERNSAIELLRIITIMMIIGGHFATHGKFSFDIQSITIPRLWWNFIEMGANFGTVVFVLISGYFLIDNRNFTLNIKKVLKLHGQILFYSVALFFFAFAIGRGSWEISVLLRAVFPITFSNWWFASTYFVLFLLHPYLNRFLHSMDKKTYQGFMLFLVVIWSIIPSFTTSAFQSNQLLEFVMFYTIAGYLKLYGLNPKLKTGHYFALWLLFSLISYGICVVLLVLGTKVPIFARGSLYFYERNSIFTVLRAVCFFMAFATMQMSCHRWINKIASAAFGVYLLHDSDVLRSYFWVDIFKNASFQNSIWIIPLSIAAVFIIYALCAVIDLIRQFAFEAPYMKLLSRFNRPEVPFLKHLWSKIKSIIFGNA